MLLLPMKMVLMIFSHIQASCEVLERGLKRPLYRHTAESIAEQL